MKVLKWGVGVLLLLVVGLVFYVTVLFDPNDFKPQIIAAVEKQTGRTMTIDRELSWTFFPSLGIEAGDITLSNPKDFAEKQMVAVNQIVANVALMPLLSKEIQVSELKLDGLQLNLETAKDGRNSFDGLTGKTEAAAPISAGKSDTHSNITLAGLNIGGISVTNAQVRILDRQQGTENIFTLSSFTLGKLALEQYAPLAYQFSGEMPQMTVASKGEGQLKISANLQQVDLKDFSIKNTLKGASIPNGEMQANLTANIHVDTAKQVLSLVLSKLDLADISGSGDMTVAYGSKVPKVEAKLAFADIDLDKLLPPSTEPEKSSEAAQPKVVDTVATEPDLSGMKAVDMALGLSIKSLKVAGLTTDNWVMNAQLNNGILELQKMTADLYQGKLSASAKVDGRNKVASYSFNSSLSQVNLRPLLTDAAKVDMLAGTANISAKGSGSSLIPVNIKKNLDVNGTFNIADGALYGINIPLMIRNAQAKLKGDLSSPKGEEQKTDFTSLSGSFTVKDGQANNPDLAMLSPLVRLSGAGGANLLQESLDYRLTTALVDSLKGQGGKTSDKLAGIEIPLLISGTFAQPKFSLDTDALFKNKLKDEAEKAKDKLKDSLFKKLGGH
ncbi:AsmA family protein [Shewanella sp. 4t3-1-2LB]|uniref:AsmA family protein n=1 Tax=Shewanella sp. 4t3-1-2LB TaxID=2817682 RepID=UPI001A984EC0|nr:AsmA family protein [Shewanella sp. 4t3-1-2LB]MBO1270210.1 AsmA family protein [Shewanella sp. 4t3-1-2LB]